MLMQDDQERAERTPMRANRELALVLTGLSLSLSQRLLP